MVKLVDIPADLKAVGNPDNELRTAELFRFCLGRQFRIHGFDRYGFCELQVSDSREVRRRFGKWHSIWVDPHFLELREKTRSGLRRQGGFGWKIDFRRAETEFDDLQKELDGKASRSR